MKHPHLNIQHFSYDKSSFFWLSAFLRLIPIASERIKNVNVSKMLALMKAIHKQILFVPHKFIQAIWNPKHFFHLFLIFFFFSNYIFISFSSDDLLLQEVQRLGNMVGMMGARVDEMQTSGGTREGSAGLGKFKQFFLFF